MSKIYNTMSLSSTSFLLNLQSIKNIRRILT